MKRELISIEMQGFKAFAKKQTLEFTDQPGLVFLTGFNEKEPSLQTNGVGKSTIIDALCWVHYDRTARGLRAKNIRSWNKDASKTKVTVVWEEDGKEVIISRTWSPNSLKWSRNGQEMTDVSQDDLETWLGMSFDAFKQCFVIPSQGDMFFDMKPAARSALFSSIMNLDHWLDKSAEASGEAKHIEAMLRDTQQNATSLEGQIAGLKETDYSNDIQNWEKDRKERLAVKRRALKQAENDLETAQNALEEAQENTEQVDGDVASLENTVKELKQNLKKLQESVDAQQRKLRDKDREISKKEAELEFLNKRIAEIEDLKGDCPTCGQAIDDHVVKHNTAPLLKDCEELKKELEHLKSDLKEIQNKIKVLKEERATVQEDIEEHEQFLEKHRSSRREADRQKARCEMTVKSAIREVRELKRSIKEIESEENPYEEKMKARDNRVAQLKEMLEKDKKALEEGREQVADLLFWAKGFKEIRVMLMEEAINQFELEVNTSLESLGLIGWEVSFSAEKETGSGSIKNEFDVLIKSPHNDSPVPWECWSGGEGQRLRLAGTTGLINLILERVGIQTNIEFWDECSSMLSPQGLEDLIATLRDRASSTRKQVWLVDHNAISNGSFSEVVRIVKKEDTSVIEYEDA